MPNNQTILSLDPSSTIVGYAAMTGGGSLQEAGLIRPENGRDESYQRIVDMRRDLHNLLQSIRPHYILVEWTKGKVGKRHQGRGAGLAVYGCGVGAIATECEFWAERNTFAQVIPILENDWTRGVKKAERTAAIQSLYPHYDPSEDPGGDLADAIGLARWWLRESLCVL